MAGPVAAGHHRQNGGCELAQRCCGIGIAPWEYFNAGATIGEHPVADEIVRKSRDRHSLWIEALSKEIKIMNERWNECGLGPGPGRGIRSGKPLQQGGRTARGVSTGCLSCCLRQLERSAALALDGCDHFVIAWAGCCGGELAQHQTLPRKI